MLAKIAADGSHSTAIILLKGITLFEQMNANAVTSASSETLAETFDPMLVNPYSSQNTSGDNYEEALNYMDKVLLIAPDYGNFHVSELVKKLEPDFKKAEPIRKLQSQIDKLLTETFKYALRPTPTQIPISLTNEDRLVKSQGGHFAYLNNRSDKEKADKERQNLNDEKLRFDVRNSKRIFKTYWWTFAFALISFIYVLIQIVLKILEMLKLNLDK